MCLTIIRSEKISGSPSAYIRLGLAESKIVDEKRDENRSSEKTIDYPYFFIFRLTKVKQLENQMKASFSMAEVSLLRSRDEIWIPQISQIDASVLRRQLGFRENK